MSTTVPARIVISHDTLTALVLDTLQSGAIDVLLPFDSWGHLSDDKVLDTLQGVILDRLGAEVIR